MRNKVIKKIIIGLSAVGPGLFLIGYNIGTGSVTTMGKAGAEYGMTLFWAVALSCIFTYILMVAYGQVTLVTGRTALFNIKNNFSIGKAIALYLLIALIATEIFALMGIMGIVSELLQEGSRLIFGGTGFGTFWIILVLCIGLYLLLWCGRYPEFEKMLTFFVGLMALCFTVVFFMLKPNISAITSGLIPHIPNKPGAFRLIAAMAGTTCSTAVFIIRSIVVTEKGWKIDNLKGEKRDAFVSAAMMLFLSGIIMAVSAGTLHVMGLKLDDTLDMIHLLEPIGGKVAAFILILGITGAGLSTVFPVILIAPWLICDYTGRARDIHSPLFRILGFIGILFCFGMVFMKQKPPVMLVLSQALMAPILPVAVIPIFILINRKKIMGEHPAGAMLNIGLAGVLLFSLVTSYFAVIDLF